MALNLSDLKKNCPTGESAQNEPKAAAQGKSKKARPWEHAVISDDPPNIDLLDLIINRRPTGPRGDYKVMSRSRK